jgi:hypothetical protein
MENLMARPPCRCLKLRKPKKKEKKKLEIAKVQRRLPLQQPQQ